ncbi:MAG TPA: hydrogenase expression/formation protein HypE [Candidatus Melainabacteria bacterium]|nr:hydrogenase expression/formation protein HypE [Candidatus Melainabacteria bacterium]HIN63521.1 hydrogenase expression/formation protein HypE [Candidatus Obscuribacterales bacterium]
MRKRSGVLRAETINMSHGGGGKAMRDLIEDVFIGAFDNNELSMLEDQARIELSTLTALGDRLALTTDSYVVDPIFFNGGDIGKLAVCGTVNDLAVGGAVPLYLTCGMIIEEGLSVADLRIIVASMKAAADAAGVKIVTGDTKVVDRGAADKVFINTAGVGVISKAHKISAHNAKPGDVVLINGYIGDHGAAIVGARGDLAIENDIQSDCQPLNKLIQSLLQACPNVHCMRDATRGGVGSVLNEFAVSSGVCFKLRETSIPVRTEVRGMCEILGLDPLYLANEGKVVVVLPKADAEAALAAMKSNQYGVNSAIIGEVTDAPTDTVILQTSFGGERIVDMLVGDQLPRIC